MRRFSLLSASLLTLPLIAVVRVGAQGLCEPPTDSHEAKTFAILSVPITFTGARAPGPAHGISLGLEAASIPTVDRTDATPTTCQPGKPPENTNPIPGFVRLRAAVAVHGFVLEGSWVPPVTVSEVQADLFGVAIARPFALGQGWFLGLRADAEFGTIHAPVVCDDAALMDAASECFNGTRSNDSWQPGLFGFETVVGMGRGRLRPHLGAGYTILQPRFQVDFTDAAGSTDRTRIEVNMTRAAVFGGLTYKMGRSSVTAEAYSTLGDAVAGRVVLRTLIGR